MNKIKILTFATLAALAATLLFQTSITRAGDNGKRDEHGQQAKATFTKWITDFPLCPGVFANMAGVVGGDVGDGSFTGEILLRTPGPVTTKIEALYHFKGSEHSFTALVHVESTGGKAVIIGVVTDGWLKGHAVEGEFTTITCDHVGPSPACFEGTLAISRDSRDSSDN